MTDRGMLQVITPWDPRAHMVHTIDFAAEALQQMRDEAGGRPYRIDVHHHAVVLRCCSHHIDVDRIERSSVHKGLASWAESWPWIVGRFARAAAAHTAQHRTDELAKLVRADELGELFTRAWDELPKAVAHTDQHHRPEETTMNRLTPKAYDEDAIAVRATLMTDLEHTDELITRAYSALDELHKALYPFLVPADRLPLVEEDTAELSPALSPAQDKVHALQSRIRLVTEQIEWLIRSVR